MQCMRQSIAAPRWACSDFRLGREGFNHTSSSNYEDRVEALLGNEEKVFSSIPSIEKEITERVL